MTERDALGSAALRPGWSDVTLGGKSVPLFVPTTPLEPAAAVLYLHGHAEITLRENPAYTPLLEQAGLYCVCPPGGKSWWVDRISPDYDTGRTPHRYLMDEIVPWMREALGLGERRIGLIGVSMGGQAVLRLAFQRPIEFPVVAAIAPAVEYHIWHGRGLPLDAIYPTAEAARQDSALLAVQGARRPRHLLVVCDPTDEEWVPSAEKFVEKLRSAGIPHEADLVTSAGGHTWDYFNAIAGKVVSFVAAGLDRESRRLPVSGE